jgi:hypothetical protein
MALMTEPGPANGYQAAHAALLCRSHRHWTGRDLIAEGPEQAEALYRAPFIVLSHNNADDPLFTYANLAAQTLFEIPWREIVGLASRYSAEAPVREERERLLTRVAEQGYIEDYQGIRVARSGKRFMIHQAIVWNLLDGDGFKLGQAASFSSWQPLIL